MADEREFTSIAELMTVPAEKIDALCEDLRLWLHCHAEIAALLVDMIAAGTVAPTATFRWIDDGKHDAHMTLQPMEAQR